MNELVHKKIIIEYDVWQPFKKLVEAEEDNLLALKKENKLLPHAGNVILRWTEGNE
jgi:hypothetical protein